MSRPVPVLLFSCALSIFAGAREADRAAPHIIMLHGGVLEDQRIFMTDWHENSRLMASLMAESAVDASALDRRPVIHVALFWNGVKWQAYARDPNKLETLTPEMAEQHGRLYPATGGLAPLFAFTGGRGPFENTRSVRIIGAVGLNIFQEHGIRASSQN